MPFDYFFLDGHFNRQYASDQHFAKVFGLFTGLALFIAGLGLYGLSLFMVSQRTKEMAIGRTLGASMSNMIGLFSKDFILLILVANLVTLPVTYFLADPVVSQLCPSYRVGHVYCTSAGIADHLFVHGQFSNDQSSDDQPAQIASVRIESVEGRHDAICSE